MSAYKFLTLDVDQRGVASVALNRPEVHNAFNEVLIAELTAVFEQLDTDGKVRLAVLSGNGKSFCAGGDLNWMKSMKDFSREENIADSKKIAAMYARIDGFSKPLIGVIQGFALGGGSGLAAVCDFVVAADNATFGFTETRIGIVPSVIAPYVVRKIGVSMARAYGISGMRFPAAEAVTIGLAHWLAAPAALAEARDEVIAEFLKAGPEASRRGKALIARVGGAVSQEVIDYTIQTIADARVSPEGQEGMTALLEGRKPKWAESL